MNKEALTQMTMKTWKMMKKMKKTMMKSWKKKENSMILLTNKVSWSEKTGYRMSLSWIKKVLNIRTKRW